MDDSVTDVESLELNFKHFRLPNGFFRDQNKQNKINYNGFLDYKYNGLKIKSSFIFNDSFKINKDYNHNFLYHNLFSFFRDYFS